MWLLHSLSPPPQLQPKLTVAIATTIIIAGMITGTIPETLHHCTSHLCHWWNYLLLLASMHLHHSQVDSITTIAQPEAMLALLYSLNYLNRKGWNIVRILFHLLYSYNWFNTFEILLFLQHRTMHCSGALHCCCHFCWNHCHKLLMTRLLLPILQQQCSIDQLLQTIDSVF